MITMSPRQRWYIRYTFVIGQIVQRFDQPTTKLSEVVNFCYFSGKNTKRGWLYVEKSLSLIYSVFYYWSSGQQPGPSVIKLPKAVVGHFVRHFVILSDSSAISSEKSRLVSSVGEPSSVGRYTVQCKHALCPISVSYTHLTLPTILLV